jgi:hypothetical protein
VSEFVAFYLALDRAVGYTIKGSQFIFRSECSETSFVPARLTNAAHITLNLAGTVSAQIADDGAPVMLLWCAILLQSSAPRSDA